MIDYKTEDFTKTVSDLDAAFDITAEVLKEIPLVRRGGKVVSIAQSPPTTDAVKAWGLPDAVLKSLAEANAPFLKAAEEHQVSYAYHFMHPDAKQLEQIGQWTQEKKLTPVIDKTFPLDEAAQALAYLKLGQATGKVVIQVI